jgi:isoleucyl-tRNA synthetase
LFKKVATDVNFVEQEHETLRFWEASKTFDALRAKNANGPRWSFLDGPITANNPMGVHHAWGRTYKDVFQRFHAMKGHHQRYQNGFDCQGLWVEVNVERELGFKTKRDIEAYGLARFVEACKERVRKYADVQTKQSIRLGQWMDWDNSYFTMTDENNYTIWSFLKKCHERGLVYRGRDSMPWCPRCGTGISQQEMHEGYQEITQDSVIVRMPLRGRTNEYLLVWTTTPWTLAANVAAAVNPDLAYAKVKQKDAVYYIAKSRLHEMKPHGPYEVVGEITGAQMEGWTYDGPFDELPAAAPAVKAHRIIMWPEVSSEEGTGIVHIAPGCGKEDYDLSLQLGLPTIAPIDESGVYFEGYGFLTGKVASEVEEAVFASLRENGYYYKKEPYSHSYPHCWRCKTALLFRNVDEWYINMSWRDDIKKITDAIRWIPGWAHDQEMDWLTNMRDWMISKKRYWGLALPIYQCECGWFDVIGSKSELKERAVEGWAEFEGHSPHRPWVDAVKIACGKCGKPVSRIRDVGNPWLDAGIVPYSTVKYNEDREYWRKWIPADFVCESFPGQFRNWFYALLAMSTMMEDIPPFKTLFGYALVRDDKGEELHKSGPNAILFDDAAERLGCDVLRWVYCRQNPFNNLCFSWSLGDLTRRDVFNKLWNVYAFFANYARLDGFDPSSPQVPMAQRSDIDRWLLSDLQLLARAAEDRYSNYDVASFVKQAEKFLDNLSNWYVRRNRRRFWRAKGQGDQDKFAAYQTLYEALVTLCKLCAPVIPFVTEQMYQNLVADQDASAPKSVHLCDFPQVKADLIDEPLSTQMDIVTSVVSAALGLRKESQIRVRQPLKQLLVISHDDAAVAALRRFEEQILDELNVKELAIKPSAEGIENYEIKPRMDLLGPKYKGAAGRVGAALKALNASDVARRVSEGKEVAVNVGGAEFVLLPSEINVKREMPAHMLAADVGGTTLVLDIEVTPELRGEGWARDTVRQIQQLRKEMDLNIEDRIRLRYEAFNADLAKTIESWAKYIAAETLCVEMTTGVREGQFKCVDIDGNELHLQVEKA